MTKTNEELDSLSWTEVDLSDVAKKKSKFVAEVEMKGKKEPFIFIEDDEGAEHDNERC